MKIDRLSSKWLIEVIATAIIYYGAARLSLLLAFENTNASPVWPPSGIAFAMILIVGYRIWPGIMIGAFLANVVVFLSNRSSDTGSILAVSSFIAIGNTLESVLGAFLIHRFVGSRNPLDRSQDVFTFVFVALLMCLVSSIVGSTTLYLAGMVPWTLYGTVWFTWWLGDTTGVLVLTPFLLTWCKKPLVHWRLRFFVELVLFLVLLLVVCQIVFGPLFMVTNYPLAFMLVPFIVWAAFRFGQSAVVLSILLVSGVAIWGTIHGFGPFVSETLNESLWLLQSFVGIVAVTGLILAAVLTERKRTEEALRENKERYRTLVEYTYDLVIEVSFNGRYLYTSPNHKDILGYEPSELVGRSIFEHIHSDDHSAVITEFWRARLTHSSGHSVLRYKHKNGEWRWLESAGKPFQTATGEIRGIITSRDITERKQAEEALIRLATAVEHAGEAIEITNAEGKIEYINPAFEKITGYTRAEVLGKTPASLFRTGRHDEAFYKAIWNTISSGRVWKGSFTGKRKDGSLYDQEVTVSPVFDTMGMITNYVAVKHDITERKRVEEALQESERRYRLLAENATDNIWTMDMNLRYTYISPSVMRIRGYSVEEVMAQTVDEVLTPPSLEVAMKTYTEELAIESMEQKDLLRSRTLDLELKCKDGSTIWTEIKMTFLRDPDNRPIGILGVTRDITERKKMEEELLRVQKLESIGVLAGGIAHDFNNLLTAILGNISLTKMYVNPEDKEYKRLTEAEKACLRAKGLTQQLLTFSKGGAPIKRVAFIRGLIKDSASFALIGSNVRCEFSISGDLWPVEVDEGQISQVINNLVINADQAVLEEGVIRVRAENVNVGLGNGLPLKEDKYVKVTIEDRGIGIPEEHLKKIFDPYFTTKQKGNGLGLATAHSIIKSHDGYIGVESKVGVGTKFYIYLPTSQKEILAKRDIEKRPVIGRGRILVMDDEEIVREVAGGVLGHLGYEVELARDGREAIELYREAKENSKPFDVVIMDLTIPGGMGGREAIKRLIEIDPEVKAIVSSGYSNDPVMAEYTKYGFREVITKPYKIEELSKILAKVINENKKHEQKHLPTSL